VTGEWRSSRRAVLANTGWRCSVYWFENRHWHPPVTVLSGYRTAPEAVAAAQAEAASRNKSSTRPA
jgi:hypothetical protein